MRLFNLSVDASRFEQRECEVNFTILKIIKSVVDPKFRRVESKSNKTLDS